MKMNDTENFVYALGLYEFIFLMYSTLDLISAALETVGFTITILFLCILARGLRASQTPWFWQNFFTNVSID